MLKRFVVPLVILLASIVARAAEREARVIVLADQPSPHPVPRFITGKFAEHLGSNIYNGMCAQIVRNPTFADWPFAGGGQTPDGRPRFLSDEKQIGDAIRHGASRLNWPEGEVQKLLESRADGLAHWWIREGARNMVRVSPDVGPDGGRAQRVEVDRAGDGIAQWMHLPLHRVRKFEYELVLRSPDIPTFTISLDPGGASIKSFAKLAIKGTTGEWQTFRGELELPATAGADSLCRLALEASAPGQFIVSRLLLWPADRVGSADADVVRLLKESRLPLLRWPGGNFVSGYRWEDGVGPMFQRRTHPNWAWGGVETNLFGTDEFIAFCRPVGCEPMICVNAGDGTPQEAARWVEYCNGPASSPMGAKRAANGHPQPYNIRHWEVGNELWGRWQVSWSTPRGNADRYRQFAEAMRKADPTITLYACGAPVLWGDSWNQALFREAGPLLRTTTDHPLIGGNVPADTDPLDVYRDFMAVPTLLEGKWADLRESMIKAGVREPQLAITELQLFAHIAPAKAGPVRLDRSTLVSPATQAEAIYDVLLYHAAVRLSPFVTMVTHSATVNHGGGLRKERERVYANPCHHAQAAFSAFAGATPVAVEITGPAEKAPLVLPDIKRFGPNLTHGTISALAALAPDGAMLISLVHRGTGEPLNIQLDLRGLKPGSAAEIWQLTAAVPWATNTLDHPDTVTPTTARLELSGNTLAVTLKPYTVMQIRVPRS